MLVGDALCLGRRHRRLRVSCRVMQEEEGCEAESVLRRWNRDGEEGEKERGVCVLFAYLFLLRPRHTVVF